MLTVVLVEVGQLIQEVKNYESVLRKLALDPIDEPEVPQLPNYSEEELAEIDVNHLVQITQKMKAELDTNRPNLGVIREFKERQRIYLERVKEFTLINDARNKKREARNHLQKMRYEGI